MHFNVEDFHVLRQVQTHSIHQRQHKVSIADFMDVAAWQTQPALRLLFPHILKGKDILSVVDGFVAAHRRGRAVIFAIGAHVIKCGLSPLLIEMMRRGWLQALVLNGAGAIHDLEVALIGMTSEDVAQNLISGQFGMVEETPRLINKALQEPDLAQLTQVRFRRLLRRRREDGEVAFLEVDLQVALVRNLLAALDRVLVPRE